MTTEVPCINTGSPHNTPVGSIVATFVLLLLQVPSGVPSPSDDDVPAHIVKPPVIDCGNALTVKVLAVEQPDGCAVNVIIVRPPGLPGPVVVAVTRPVPEIPATPGVLLVQLPGADASLNCEVNPAQMAILPVIAAGKGLTAIVVVIRQVVPSLYVIVSSPETWTALSPCPIQDL